MTRNRTLTVLGLYLAGIVAALALTALTGFLPPHLPFVALIRLCALLAAMLVGMGFAGAAWRRTDEAAREAHKSAAFWGAPFGLLAGITVLALAATLSTPRNVLHADTLAILHAQLPQQPLVLMICGALIVVVAGLAGYFLFWTGWWFTHSGGAKATDQAEQ